MTPPTGRRRFASVFEAEVDEGYLKGLSLRRAVVRNIRRVALNADEPLSTQGVINNSQAFSVIDRLGLSPGAMVAEQVAGIFGGEQIIQVDDQDLDPNAVDFESYTVWGRPDAWDQAEVNDIIEAEITGEETWADGVRWIATSVVLLA